MLFRTLILKLAQSEALMNFIAHMGRRSGLAGRFVAGESIEEAMPVVQELNDKGIVNRMSPSSSLSWVWESIGRCVKST